MHRVMDCKAFKDYRLWLRFEDGFEGTVFLGDLLEVKAFEEWLDVSKFCRVELDAVAATVAWQSGIRLDPDILYQDLLSRRGSNEFSSPGHIPAVG